LQSSLAAISRAVWPWLESRTIFVLLALPAAILRLATAFLEDPVLVCVQHLHPLERPHRHLPGLGRAIMHRTY